MNLSRGGAALQIRNDCSVRSIPTCSTAIWCIALQRKPECFREDIRTTENLAELEVRREKLMASST